MNLKKLVIYLFSFWIILSCSSHKPNTNEIVGKKFTAKTENRRLEIKIIDAENLEITNEFFCTNIDEKFRKVVFNKKYHRNQNSIILTDSIFNFRLPYFNNSNCLFLSEKYRSTEDRKIFDGRTINSNQEELYSIWNMDTLKIIKNKLIYIKKVNNGSQGYLFK